MYTPVPIVRFACRSDPVDMTTTSHLHAPIDAIASPGPIGVNRALAILEGTLTEIASQTAVAAESLRHDRNDRAPVSDNEVATWWLDRLVRAALATRDTCRAARAAVDDRGSSDGEDRSAEPPRAASPDASPHPILPARAHAGRWIVVGYDGSEAAERALLRAADAAGERDAVVIVTTTAQIYSAGAAAEPLLEPSADPSELLAAAKATVTGPRDARRRRRRRPRGRCRRGVDRSRPRRERGPPRRRSPRQGLRGPDAARVGRHARRLAGALRRARRRLTSPTNGDAPGAISGAQPMSASRPAGDHDHIPTRREAAET